MTTITPKDLIGTIELIKDNKLSPNIVISDVTGMTYPLLVWAIKQRNDNLIDFLLQSGADINYYSGENYNALIAAILEKRDDLVQRLLALGADVNCMTAGYPMSALMACAFTKNNELCEQLLKMGARPQDNPSALGYKPCTALYMASREGNSQMCSKLIEHYPKDWPIWSDFLNFEAMLGSKHEGRELIERCITERAIKIEHESMTQNVQPGCERGVFESSHKI